MSEITAAEAGKVNTGVVHPFTGHLYEKDADGNIVVTGDGQTGLFRRDGSWISGDIREADPQLCNWVGGPKLASHRLQREPDEA